MSFWKKLFGGDSKPTPVAPVAPQQRSLAPKATAPSAPASARSLVLPPDFDGDMSYRDMFRTRTPEQLRVMCRALPVEQLDLNRPGRPPNAREMGRAITQVFAVSIYMATKDVPAEFGDIVFPRLVGQIAKYNGADLHLELCDLVRDFATHLAGVERNQEAVRVLRVLKQSLFWHTFSQGEMCLFGCLHNIAQKTNQRTDLKAALEAAKDVPANQLNQFPGLVKNLEQKIAALP